ncbi:MAG: hypothetical protein ACUVUG_02885 [Candidatus Aminicenantia bacterium]
MEIVLFFLILISCLKSIQNSPERIPFFWKSYISSGVEIKEEWAFPKNQKIQFSKDDGSIFCTVELRNLSSEHFLQWKWLGADGKLYRESTNIKIGSVEDKKSVIAWDKIEIKDDTQRGRWIVVIFLDGKAIDKKEFEII